MIKVINLHLPPRLKAVDLQLPSNGLIGIIGPNGAGKSSLLKCLAGIETAQHGEVQIDDQSLTKIDYRKRGQLIGYLAQNTTIAWDMPVYETLALGFVDKQPAALEKSKIIAMAEAFALKKYLHESIFKLSGGELARVHLARALIKESPILLADEPIAALDPFYQVDMMEHLKQRAKCQLCAQHRRFH